MKQPPERNQGVVEDTGLTAFDYSGSTQHCSSPIEYGGKVRFRSTPRRHRFTGDVSEPLTLPSHGGWVASRTPLPKDTALCDRCQTLWLSPTVKLSSVAGGPGRNLHLHRINGGFTDRWAHSCPADPLATTERPALSCRMPFRLCGEVRNRLCHTLCHPATGAHTSDPALSVVGGIGMMDRVRHDAFIYTEAVIRRQQLFSENLHRFLCLGIVYPQMLHVAPR